MSGDSEVLSPGEIRAASGGAVGVEAQHRVLTAHGVPHRVVGKRIVLSRYHLREWLAGRTVAPSRAPLLELVK